jgi:hypothetical protein
MEEDGIILSTFHVKCSLKNEIPIDDENMMIYN